MGPLRRKKRGVPRFPPSMWSVYDRTLANEDRTNNFAEAAHKRLQRELDVSHPSLWKFIDGLRTVQAGLDLMQEAYLRGETPPAKRSRYSRNDERILKIVNDFENRTLLEYLQGIAMNVLLN